MKSSAKVGSLFSAGIVDILRGQRRPGGRRRKHIDGGQLLHHAMSVLEVFDLLRRLVADTAPNVSPIDVPMTFMPLVTVITNQPTHSPSVLNTILKRLS